MPKLHTAPAPAKAAARSTSVATETVVAVTKRMLDRMYAQREAIVRLKRAVQLALA